MRKEIIETAKPIQQLKQKYEAQGLPFDNYLNDAITNATNGIRNESTRSIVQEVARILAAELKRCIKKKLDEADQRPGTTWFGRFWRRFWSS